MTPDILQFFKAKVELSQNQYFFTFREEVDYMPKVQFTCNWVFDCYKLQNLKTLLL